MTIIAHREMRQRMRKGRKPNRGNGELGRLPEDFCWKLFSVLVSCARPYLSSGLFSLLSGVSRRRISAEYFGLDTQLGLQCIAEWAGPMPGNPAVIHMITQAFRKCQDIELNSSVQRKRTCLDNVQQIDQRVPTLRKEWLTDPVYVKARGYISYILGDAPTPDAVANRARHGPGSTASSTFAVRSKYFKYCTWPYASSPSARGLLAHCIRTDDRWLSALDESARKRFGLDPWNLVVPGLLVEASIDGTKPFNIVTTVPKDGRKDRPIAKEQVGNIYLQLGIGSILRSRLKLVGVDLDYQAETNRDLALESSQTKELFTIDLSNASDTIGCDLVRALLPPDWFQLLDSLRSPWGIMPDGCAFLYRKFSSMGNGFTFELETLVFLALSYGISCIYGDVRGDRRAVFGDDIIAPDYLYLHHLQYLEYSGFQVNSEKSFHGTSRVRESCGVDALDGLNIRPVYVKGTPSTLMEFVSLRNRLRAWFLTQLGDYPEELELFFLNYLKALPPIGPDSIEFDGWWQDGPYAEGRRFDSLISKTVQLPAREFGFRRLMHNLRSCTGDGGNFIVSETSERVSIVSRVVVGQSHDWLMNTARPGATSITGVPTWLRP